MNDRCWIRSGVEGDHIGSIAFLEYEEFSQAVRPLFQSGPIPYSGIILTEESVYQGEVIEKSSYKSGGLVFLYRAYRQPPSDLPDFPTARLKLVIEAFALAYVREILGVADASVSLQACWAVCQRAGDYGTLHNHIPPSYSGKTRYSGILYLASPRSINPSTFPNGCIHILAGQSVLYFPPIPGTMIFWPSELLHGIHPFRGRGERHAISFDFVVNKEVR